MYISYIKRNGTNGANEMAAKQVLATIGKTDQSAYESSDWVVRDNFDTMGQAESYAISKSRMYPATPYRIRELRGRFAVEFVPEWKLR